MPSTYDEFRVQINSIFADGDTNFSLPLIKLCDIIKDGEYKRLNVLFITDGEDQQVQSTSQVTKVLYELLTKKEMQSQFSVFGIGNHESELLDKLASLGSLQGQYLQYRNELSKEEKEATMKKAFEDIGLDLKN